MTYKLNIKLRNELLLQWVAGFIANTQVLKIQTENIQEKLLFESAIAIEQQEYLEILREKEMELTRQRQLYNALSQILTFRTEKEIHGPKLQYTSKHRTTVEHEMLAYLDLSKKWKELQHFLNFQISDKTLRTIFESLSVNFDPIKVEKMRRNYSRNLEKMIDMKANSIAINKLKNLPIIINELQKEKPVNDTTESIDKQEAKIELLKNLYSQAIDNCLKQPNGRRYPDCKDVYLLFFLLGKKTYGLCEQILCFPSFKTMKEYKNDKIKQLFNSNSSNPNLFNGDDENVCLLIDALYPKNITEEQKKVVLAIDAASVRANITIDENGLVTGLKNSMTLDKTEAKTLIEDESKFKEFCAAHIKEAIQAIFTVLLIPLDNDIEAFPICEIAAECGNASEEILNKLDSLKTVVEQKDFSVIGFACDGDPQYLEDANMFVNDCINEFLVDNNKPIIHNFNNLKRRVVFYDALHLGKNNRYYYSVDCFLFAWVNPEAERISRKDFEEIGIPKEVLDKKANKMDDNLALKLFTFDNVKKCFIKGKRALAFALLPMTLLFKAIFGDAKRQERITFLSIGFALMLLYVTEANDQQKINKYVQRNNRSKDPNDTVRLFPNNFCAKYMELTYNLIQQLSLNTKIHLGALGSHILEHWFGLVRRLAYGDFTPQTFDIITKKVILFKSLCKSLKCTTKLEKRKSDSGCILDKDEIDPVLKPIGSYIACAYILLRECGIPLMNTSVYEELKKQYSENMDVASMESLLELNEDKRIIIDDGKKSMQSLRKLGIGVANSINPRITFAVNSDIMKIDVPKVPMTLKVMEPKKIQSSPKEFKGLFGKREKNG